ncbi:hypothetical protein [Bacillus sp. NEB1478]|uniref:hypothetical protein n=1 Tax=Bacillus sp. NEB1478 TaxID=3073816 RepID=UPI00287352AC|nr:hypothetical protein [Bacillus sp. NEB1478]WNB92588.1 hypothetical protein RGB74_02670 [Bacillus sp. NEB1478]
MKIKNGITVVLLVIFLAGCLGKKDTDLSQHPLMSEMEGEFSLFVLDKKLDTITSESLRNQGIINVHKIQSGTSLKSAQKSMDF